MREAYDQPQASLADFLRHMLGTARLPSREAKISEAFDAWVRRHPQLSATQLMFVRTLRRAVLQRAELASVESLRQPPFSSIGDPEKLFPPNDLREVLELAQSLAGLFLIMLSPQLRQKVHNLWSLFWIAGISNPLSAIEQITYLLFIRQLENLDIERVKQGKISIYVRETLDKAPGTDDYSLNPIWVPWDQCRWSYIKQNPSFELLNGTVFPWLRGLEAFLKKVSPANDAQLREVTDRLNDAYFILDPNKTDTLARAITLIDELFRHIGTRSVNADIMGDIFEHLLEEVKESGKNGQFRTPRHVIRFMVEALDPALGTNILDPACGSGGFLLNTILHWKARHTAQDVLRLEWDGTPHDVRPVWPQGRQLDLNSCFHGYDNDRTMVRIAWMNLILHDLEFPLVTHSTA